MKIIRIRKTVYLLFFFSFFGFSQVGINTTTPDPSSILDLSSSNKGFLVPRVSLTELTDQTTIQSPAKGLLVFKSGSTGIPEGFYFWNGNQWEQLNSGKSDAWFLEGNDVVTSQALGTNNMMPLLLKTNDQIIANFNPSGGFALGLGGIAHSSNAIAIGSRASAVSLQNIAVGMGSQSNGDNTFALGTYAVATGDFAAAVGTNASAAGKNSTAFGHLANSMGQEAVAIGGGAKAEQLSAVALGPYSEATAEKSFALGPNTKATAVNSFALGIGAEADVMNTVIIGEVQVPGGEIVAPVNVGIGTKSPKGRIDVHGDFKLGKKGNVLKGVSGFQSTVSGITTAQANSSVIISFPIPTNLQPESTQAVIESTLGASTNDAIAITWAKFDDTSSIRVKFRNESETEVDFDALIINFIITEF